MLFRARKLLSRAGKRNYDRTTKTKKLGKVLWGIANELRGAMNANDFRDYILSFLFLRYLSDNYEDSVKKELTSDYPKLDKEDKRTPCTIHCYKLLFR